VKSVSSRARSTSHSAVKPATPSPSKPTDSPGAPVPAVVEDPITTVKGTTDQALTTVGEVLAPVNDAVPELGVELP
jgi:hypothetical protein